MESQTTVPPDEIIVCKVTRWYYRRMGLMMLMMTGLGAFFFYDGQWGYHKANKIPEAKEWFESTVVKEYEAAKAQGPEAEAAWMQQARDKGWVSAKVKEPRWDDYAAPRGWDSNPKKYSAEEIEQQFYWGWGMMAGTLFVGVLVLINRNKTLEGFPAHMEMPNGAKVAYSEIYKLDKRKWDNKGLAYAWYRKSETEAGRKTVIDDLKYGGAFKVLDRIMANFKGELIEKVADPEEEGTEETASTTEASAGTAPNEK